ncbi:GNAT family N-acetyltransferase [Aquimarina agarilytica]|uniref:GNAT family N-acetyltransferase n=1 Tax=Aquimarina agarilytica TaxID=1087449 RepID=UPI000288715C|nr:GNAT family N-acetyltransferase [Aquimarina agarilytica]
MVYSKIIDGFGEIQLRELDLKKDALLLHSWVTLPYAQYWGMQKSTIEEVCKEYEALRQSNDHKAFIGMYKNRPIFLMEKYKASEDEIAKYYDCREGDYGMHVLVAPLKRKIPHFTWYIFTTILEYFFSDIAIKRIVVEPDVNNDKIHVLNKKAGFKYHSEIQLPHKKAALAFCDRNSYRNALIQVSNNEEAEMPKVNHLKAKIWNKVNKSLVKKAISEFSHELLLQPKLISSTTKKNTYKLDVENTDITYFFEAERLYLDHWEVDEKTLRKEKNEISIPVNAIEFILEFKEVLGIPTTMLPTYLEEISSTLSSACYKYKHQKYTSEELVNQDFQEIEHALTEGHPCFVANNGRIGFNIDEYGKYAPEADQSFQIIWLAGKKDRTTFSAIEGYTYNTLMHNELGAKIIAKFNNRLESLDLDIESYIFIPVHPWQWNNKLIHIFATDIANSDLVYLGKSNDLFSAQQSIRTLYNISNPKKLYTKTALSILNMGFMRGLSPYYMQSTPPITKWITSLFENDAYLLEKKFTMLGEVATVGYRNLTFEALGKSSAHNKMLSALWRESPHSKIESNQQLMAMASFLHVDTKGSALISHLINKSQLTISAWISKYLDCYLAPLVHCFYKYELVFMPHGENLIMVMENHIPVKVLMKDITEEVIVFNEDMVLPKHVDRLFTKTSDKMKVLSIFTDVFDSFFRFLSAILHKHTSCTEDEFWNQVAICVKNYQEAHPEFQSKYEQYDLFASEFDRCCLNRLQLKNTKQMLDLADPIESLELHGTLKNPLTKFRIPKPQLQHN